MIVNDKVIAKPIVMYIGNIPVAALPFAVFPHRTGRHSGIIIPRYGESAREGPVFLAGCNTRSLVCDVVGGCEGYGYPNISQDDNDPTPPAPPVDPPPGSG